MEFIKIETAVINGAKQYFWSPLEILNSIHSDIIRVRYARTSPKFISRFSQLSGVETQRVSAWSLRQAQQVCWSYWIRKTLDLHPFHEISW